MASARRPDIPDVVFDDGVLPPKSHLLDLAVDPGGAQGVIADALLNVILERIEFAFFAGFRLRWGRCPDREVFA